MRLEGLTEGAAGVIGLDWDWPSWGWCGCLLWPPPLPPVCLFLWLLPVPVPELLTSFDLPPMLLTTWVLFEGFFEADDVAVGVAEGDELDVEDGGPFLTVAAAPEAELLLDFVLCRLLLVWLVAVAKELLDFLLETDVLLDVFKCIGPVLDCLGVLSLGSIFRAFLALATMPVLIEPDLTWKNKRNK